jgi:hypothetical protein
VDGTVAGGTIVETEAIAGPSRPIERCQIARLLSEHRAVVLEGGALGA